MRPGTLDTSSRPFVLIWELTRACGLACDHCRADAKPDRHPDELSTAEGTRLLDPAEADAVMAWLDDSSDAAPFGVKTTEAPQYRCVSIQRRDERNGRGDPGDSRPADGVRRRSGIVAGDGFAFVSHTGDVFPPDSCRSRPATSVADPYTRATGSRRCSNRYATAADFGASAAPVPTGGSVAAAVLARSRRPAIPSRAIHSVRSFLTDTTGCCRGIGTKRPRQVTDCNRRWRRLFEDAILTGENKITNLNK
ncbi:radical SAM protein [Natronolimnohabitans innermongolicus JCM 12255]|uniref:Radical SAM protein n=1 Tax=Natronolimnohabitans innermongolicus JCM 12255 TaxID=1227499 RepID=L9XK49_9EURY|nr:radical SAM protein [Natronolimnohabitans innermongolicus JCM 12255]